MRMKMGKAKTIYNDLTEGIDEPIQTTGLSSLFKKGKIRCRIIFEDQSYKDYWKKLDKSYVIEINKKTYFLEPSCILRGKESTISWYFNNPVPIIQTYEKSKLSMKKIIGDKEWAKLPDKQKKITASTFLDSDSATSVFNSRLIQGMYANTNMSLKQWLLIGGVVIIVILVLLQVTGAVDIVGGLKGII